MNVDNFNKNNSIQKELKRLLKILKEDSVPLDKLDIGNEYRIISVDEYYYIISNEYGQPKSIRKGKNGRVNFKTVGNPSVYPRFLFKQNISFIYAV